MARIKYAGTGNDKEKDFLKLFNQLTYSRSGWQVWEDLMTVMACSICNAVDRREGPFERREKQYERAITALGGVEIPAQIFGIITMALEENPNQDFLGKLYMSLNLGSHWHGQFFTPYHISEFMAKLTIGEGCRTEIEEKGYVSVNDSCVGAGAMLIAAAAAFRECGVNYHTSALFIGQDVDPVVAKMAYIQISLLGCPGYITVGNSLTNPQTGHVLFPEENEGQELWITPLFMHQVWEMRRTGALMQSLFSGIGTTVKTMEKEHKKEDTMEKEVLHFTETPEFEHFPMEKFSQNDNAYGIRFGELVREYLETVYSGEDAKAEVVSDGIAYKILKREEVTVFYDADGNTLFDVENKRLEKEYKLLMDVGTNSEEDDSDEKDEKVGTDKAAEKESQETGETPNEKQEENLQEDVQDGLVKEVSAGECTTAGLEDSRQRAKEKLEREVEAAQDKTFAGKVIAYLLKRCAEDEGLAQDVVQEHKTWEKCFKYIYNLAMKQAKGNSAFVDDEVVFEWAEDYYHKDDKAEDEKKAREKAETARKKEVQKPKSEKSRPDKSFVDSAVKRPATEAKAKVQVRENGFKPTSAEPPKKNNKDMEGQMDLFSLMGL